MQICCWFATPVPEGAQVPPHFPFLPFLKGAEDTCADPTWWITKTASALIRSAPETKNKHALVHRSVHLSRRSRCASDVLSKEACRSSVQREQWISYFFISMLGLYLVEEGLGTSVN